MSKVKRKRNWLNPTKSHDTGSIATNIYTYLDDDFNDGDQIRAVEASLKIRDCSRSIDLNFDCGGYFTDNSPKDRLKKIQIIRDHLDLIEAAVKSLDDE